MRIVVINNSGTVGKSTVALHLLHPRMKNAPIFSVESINSGIDDTTLDVEKLRGNKFGQLSEKLLVLESAIIDVGASNVEDFLHQMQQYHGSHEDIDLFIVPTIKEHKVQEDTVNTIRQLQTLGVPREKIRLVFNKLDTKERPEEEFTALFGLAKLEKSFVLDATAVIYRNEVFEMLKNEGVSLGEVVNDNTDYRQKIINKEYKNQKERDAFARRVAIRRLAETANANLDEVFKVLCK